MPWRSGSQFAERHNRKLKGAAANRAARVATAMIAKGVPEGTAIATANARGNEMQRGRKKGSVLHDHARSPR